VKLVSAADLDQDTLDEAAAIHDRSFAEHLRTPFPRLLEDDVRVLVGDDGHPQGYAVLRALAGTHWTFLRYIAVGRRGGGVGSLLWRELTAALRERGDTRLMLDVEDPDDRTGLGADEAEHAERLRRIAFYERLGARLLGIRGHRAEPRSSTSQTLLLMVAALDGADRAPGADAADRRRIVEAVYEHRYGVPPGDPVLETVLRENDLA
jgi:hypothetical protein